MSLCSRVKGFSRTHEHVADFFSLMAIVLLFATIWASMQFYSELMQWLEGGMVMRIPVLIVAILVDMLLIFAFLSIGSARFAEGEEDVCFRTFPGRRHSNISVFTAFTNWVSHMEHVSKKHR